MDSIIMALSGRYMGSLWIIYGVTVITAFPTAKRQQQRISTTGGVHANMTEELCESLVNATVRKWLPDYVLKVSPKVIPEKFVGA
jgi:hypothetical protein